MKRCEYCAVEMFRPREVSHAVWAARIACCRSHAKLARSLGARMTCAHCDGHYHAKSGHGCFCSPVCGEAHAELDLLQAVRDMAAWQPRMTEAA